MYFILFYMQISKLITRVVVVAKKFRFHNFFAMIAKIPKNLKNNVQSRHFSSQRFKKKTQRDFEAKL